MEKVNGSNSSDNGEQSSIGFLAGADEVWLKEYLERLKKSTAAAEIYHAGAGKSRFYRLGEFIRVLAIVILVALFIAFLALLLI